MSDPTFPPDVPPEIPPPWRPEPSRPMPSSPRPGVPLVPWPVQPSSDPATDLLGHRVVLLSGPLTRETASQAAASLMSLDADSADDVTLHLDCAEADLAAALLLADTIDLMRADVTAIARGTVTGAALAPFAVATRRLCTAHAVFHLQAPRITATGTAAEVASRAAALQARLDELYGWIAGATDRTVDDVAEDFDRGRRLDAEKALEHGLVEAIARSGRGDDALEPDDPGHDDSARES